MLRRKFFIFHKKEGRKTERGNEVVEIVINS